MRLRIQSFAPLPAAKVWFTPDEHNCTTVADLKAALARDVLVSSTASTLDLSLEGFDLLDASALSSVLRDGDLIVVKASEKPTEVIKKRKRSPSLISFSSPTSASPAPKRTLSSSLSSSSTSDSSSSSASDSDSSSESSSASYRHTSVSQSQKAPRAPIPSTVTAKRLAPTRTVPPGKGKPSTHSRNLRRRVKKRAATAATLPAPPNFVSDANATLPSVARVEPGPELREAARIHGPAPDVAAALNNAFNGNEILGRLDPGMLAPGSPQSVASSTLHTPLYPLSDAEEALNVQMMSMIPRSKNKNKSRRARQGIDPRSRKIVFGTSDDGEQEAQARLPALIPPSSLPAHLVPVNLFITAVDVEEGLKNKSKRQKCRVETEEKVWDVIEADDVVLDYGEESVAKAPNAFDLDLSVFDIDAAPLITSHEQLTEGCMIGFSGLIVNMKTLTPEMGKRYGRVLSWTDGVLVTIRPVFDGEEAVDDEDMEWTEVVGTWKLLP